MTGNGDAAGTYFLFGGLADALPTYSWFYRVLWKPFEGIFIRHYAGVKIDNIFWCHSVLGGMLISSHTHTLDGGLCEKT